MYQLKKHHQEKHSVPPEAATASCSVLEFSEDEKPEEVQSLMIKNPVSEKQKWLLTFITVVLEKHGH